MVEMQNIDHQLLEAILLYLYTDQVEIPSRKMDDLSKIGLSYGLVRRITFTCFCLPNYILYQIHLHEVCEHRNAQTHNKINDFSTSSQLAKSTFTADLNKLVLSPDFADTTFLWPFDESTSSTSEDIVIKSGVRYHRIYAHKAILWQLEYFQTMFSGHFRYVKAPNSIFYNCRVTIYTY